MKLRHYIPRVTLTLYAPLICGVCLLLGSAASANQAQLILDFGSAEGRTSPEATDFKAELPPGGEYQLLTNAARIAYGEVDGFQNASLLRTFLGLGNGATYDFIIEADTRVYTSESSLNRRWGIHLFNSGDTRYRGISAQVMGAKSRKHREIALRYGLDGKLITTAILGPGSFKDGQEYSFKVVGEFLNETDLKLSLTVSDGTNTQTVSSVIESTYHTDTQFGLSARLRSGWVLDFYNFKVTLP
ncbi:MAG TPA: hypothetical protein DCX06_01415 [Opitutae bacterium]|nr:hypothetical protein [Opitutae bacterium]